MERAAVWFVKWWRGEGCAKTGGEGEWVATSGERAEEVVRGGWGFDFEWEVPRSEVEALASGPGNPSQQSIEPSTSSSPLGPSSASDCRHSILIQRAMERVIDDYMLRIEEEQSAEGSVSKTQVRKKEKEEQKKRREKRVKALLERRRAGG